MAEGGVIRIILALPFMAMCFVLKSIEQTLGSPDGFFGRAGRCVERIVDDVAGF